MESFATYYRNRELIRYNSAIVSDIRAKGTELKQRMNVLFRRLDKLEEMLQACRVSK